VESSAELAGHLKPRTVIAIHSTISDTTAAELAAEFKQQGIHIVDAPVSGGAAAAAKGELATMVGADREVYERDQAGLQTLGGGRHSCRRAGAQAPE